MRDLLLEGAIAITQEEIDGIAADIGHSHVEMVIGIEVIDNDVLWTCVIADRLLRRSDKDSLTLDIYSSIK